MLPRTRSPGAMATGYSPTEHHRRSIVTTELWLAGGLRRNFRPLADVTATVTPDPRTSATNAGALDPPVTQMIQQNSYKSYQVHTVLCASSIHNIVLDHARASTASEQVSNRSCKHIVASSHGYLHHQSESITSLVPVLKLATYIERALNMCRWVL